MLTCLAVRLVSSAIFLYTAALVIFVGLALAALFSAIIFLPTDSRSGTNKR